MRALLPVIAALTVLPSIPANAAASAPSPIAALAAQEARVAAIGFRLTTANAAWCPALQPQFGWIWGDPRLYPAADRSAMRAAYDAQDVDAPYVAAIVAGSPAAAAGIRVGMPVTHVNDTPVPPGESDHPYARITALEKMLAALPPRAIAMIGGEGIDARGVAPTTGCASDFRLEDRDREGAVADGRAVYVDAGLARFAPDDDELAAAIAHELAHNILRHRARLDAAGVDRGIAKQFGRNARLFKQTEVEADRLSVWLLANAGYDPRAAVRFWDRFGQRKGRPAIQAATHPRWRDRVASFETEIAAIEQARAAGRPLEPPLIANPPPLDPPPLE